MKVLVFVKATPNSEQGIFPKEKMSQLLSDMGKFNEQLIKAGIMKEADGLKPSRFGKRIKFSDEGGATVFDGPFAETKELVAGYWVWEVKSMDEAVSWAKKCPNPMPGEEGVLELRPTNSLEDFAEFLTEEQRAGLERLEEGAVAKRKPAQRARGTAKSKAKAKKKPATGASARRKK